MIEIYTDGAYNPVLNQGGWGAVLLKEGEEHSFSGIVKHTTSNRMEITAAFEGLQRTPQNAVVAVYTDSQYLYGCVAKGWQRKANNDLWEQLDKAAGQRKVHWHWLDQSKKNHCHKKAHDLATALASQVELPDMPNERKQPGPSRFTHVDESGRPRMVDISAKPDTEREAVAGGTVRMKPSTFEQIKKGQVAKGEVLSVAQLAGIMATKRTADLIPLCHPILIGDARVEFHLDEKDSAIGITATVKSIGKTGVEMEALTAVAVAALTIYDMCKAADRGMKIENIRLLKKSGGKSGTILLE